MVGDAPASGPTFESGEATVVLPAWAGHARMDGDLTDGTVTLIVMERDPETFQEQIAWLQENDAELYSVVMSALASEYRHLRNQYNYSPEDKARLMPAIEDADELHGLVELRSIHLHDESGTIAEGADWPTLGFDFACRWDSEHGCGVRTRGMSVDEAGLADVAF